MRQHLITFSKGNPSSQTSSWMISVEGSEEGFTSCGLHLLPSDLSLLVQPHSPALPATRGRAEGVYFFRARFIGS